MTDGIYVKGLRPASKKAIKEAIAADLASVEIESTSFFGGYSGPVTELPIGQSVTFVGPDPYTSRKFYGTLVRTAQGVRVK